MSPCSVLAPVPPFPCAALLGTPATAYIAVYADEAAPPKQARAGCGAPHPFAGRNPLFPPPAQFDRPLASVWPWQLAQGAEPPPAPPRRASSDGGGSGAITVVSASEEGKDGEEAAGGGKEGDEELGAGVTHVADESGGDESDSDGEGAGGAEVRIGGASRATGAGRAGGRSSAGEAPAPPQPRGGVVVAPEPATVYSLPVPILAAAAKAKAAAAAAGAPPPSGRFILHVLRRAWDPVGHPEWAPPPWDAPRPGYDAEMAVSLEAPAVDVGLRLLVVFEGKSPSFEGVVGGGCVTPSHPPPLLLQTTLRRARPRPPPTPGPAAPLLPRS